MVVNIVLYNKQINQPIFSTFKRIHRNRKTFFHSMSFDHLNENNQLPLPSKRTYIHRLPFKMLIALCL